MTTESSSFEGNHEYENSDGSNDFKFMEDNTPSCLNLKINHVDECSSRRSKDLVLNGVRIHVCFMKYDLDIDFSMME